MSSGPRATARPGTLAAGAPPFWQDSTPPAVQERAAQEDRAIERTMAVLRRAALTLGLLVAALLPAAQWLFGAQTLDALLDGEAAQVADELSKRAARNPEGWIYEVNAVDTLFRELRQREVVQAVRLLDSQQREVVLTGPWAASSVRTTSAQVLDAGVPVGQVELQASTRRVWRSALEMAMASALLAAAIWWVVHVAIRSLRMLILRLQAVRRDAEAANRAKGAFLAAMSHEIRTPMNGVLGLAELLAHTRLDDDQADTLRTLRESAQSLLRILDDLLDFSKIEAGRLELEQVPVSITALAESACETLAPLAGERAVRLAVLVADDVHDTVLGDPTRLRQVLTNLVGNAVKFSADRPGQPGRVWLRVSQRGEELRLAVHDNGIGIDSATQARLFQPFTQAESSTTRRYGGTGLGLTISRRLVALMGGEITLDSQPGVGSTFTVHLRLPKAEPAAPRVQADPPLRGVHALLLDSQALPVAELRQWLLDCGATVQTVATLQALRAQPQPLHRQGQGAPAVLTVLVHDDDSDAAQDLLRELDPEGELRQLVLGSGRRKLVRVVTPFVATLDLLRRTSFLRAMAMLAGRASPEAVAMPAPIVRHGSALPSRAEAQAAGRLILVAEDDPTNRAVIQRQLEVLGLRADVVDDGRQALAHWRDGPYALLLTDLHMPHLDGYALARAIRAEEAERGLPRMPILALTANALKAEAARARVAGIDDYLTKPAPLLLLRAALDMRLPAAIDNTTSASADEVLDVRVLREMIGADPDSLREMLQAYADQLEGQAPQLVERLQQGAAGAAAALAHRLKSSSRAVGALAMATLCQRIESEAATTTENQRQGLAQGLQQLAPLTVQRARQWTP